MTAEAFAVALLLAQQPEFLVSVPEAQALAVEIERSSRKYALPVLLLASVVLIESGGRSVVSSRRRCGGWDVGPLQIHTHDGERLRRLLALSVNVDEGARLVRGSLDKCAAHPGWAACSRCAAGLFNANSTRWCSRLMRVWRRLEDGWRSSNV